MDFDEFKSIEDLDNLMVKLNEMRFDFGEAVIGGYTSSETI
jgi:hypothetical protein